MSDLLSRISSLSPEKASFLARRNPLSFAQQRLWFLDQLQPQQLAYVIPSVIRLKGPLDPGALISSINEIVRRHEVLRTCFPEVQGVPIQLISPALKINVPSVDLSELSDDASQKEAVRLEFAEAQGPFDLTRTPLIRVTLLRLANDDHTLLLTMHHIISDGWSMGVILNEITLLYQAIVKGEESPLEELPIHYADFAQWQREYLMGDELECQLAYWRETLNGVPLSLELLVGKPRPDVQSLRGAAIDFSLGKRESEMLKELSRKQGATLFQTLLAAFKVLLYRYSGQEDIVIGTPVANRNRVEFEKLIGFFVNTLVLRTRVEGEASFREVLRRVREVTLGAYENRDAPFERLVEELQPERSLNHTPLFQVFFIFNEGIGKSTELRSLTISRFEADTKTAIFDLVLTIDIQGRTLTGELTYRTDLYQQAEIEWMVEHFKRLLESIVEQPEWSISELQMLSEAERKQLLVEWNDTQQLLPHNTCLHDLFEQQAFATPHAVAIVCGSQQLTYIELNRRANQLAHYLIALGVRPEMNVGFMLSRSLEMVVGLLGILKVGVAYMPLDHAYPKDRLAFMVEDANLSVLLIERSLTAYLPKQVNRVIWIDSDWPLIARMCEDNPVSNVVGENPAYIIYTSGSTGRPKGVVGLHKGAINRFAWMWERFPFELDEVCCQKTSLGFVDSIWELFGPLLKGLTIVIIPEERVKDPRELIRTLSKHQVSRIVVVPSLLAAILDSEEEIAGKLARLRTWITSGEALTSSLAKKFRERLPEARLLNLYGMSEASADASYWEVRQDCVEGETIMIGEPISNTAIYILDNMMMPLGIGMRGEIYISGEGLSRGYYNKSSMTAERFVPNPYSKETGRRMYRTGDLGRYREDGKIEYLGRADEQVKLKGYRIELGEIEAALMEHELVRQAAVIIKGEGADKRLVAYVVPGESIRGGELRSYLKQKLPNYMVPTSVSLLEALPVSVNGKVDREALQNSSEILEDPDVGASPARTPIEKILSGIWAEVLGLKQVGVHDSFFDLGGDSIRSIQVRAKAQQAGIIFTIQDLFQNQTIDELSRACRLADPRLLLVEAHSPGAFSLILAKDRSRLPEDLEDAYPLSVLQTGMLFHAEYSHVSVAYHNVFSFQVNTLIDILAMRTAIDLVLLRHPILRTSFDLANFSEPLQLVHRKVGVPLEIKDISHLVASEQEKELRAVFESERRHRFDWRRAPLVRFHVVLRSENRFQFFMTEHHAILDGWSVAILLAELFKTYLSLIGGGSSDMEPLRSNSFRDFVDLERQALRSEECRRFWDRKMISHPFSRLPRLASGNDGRRTHKTVSKEIQLPLPLVAELKQQSRLAAVPLKSVLFTAHLKVMSLLTGRPSVLTGYVSHGRPESEDGHLALGLFLNTVPFCMDLRGGTWLDLVHRTFEAEQEILPFLHYPMGQVQRDQGGTPLFETAFNYTHFHIYNYLKESTNIDVLPDEGFAETEIEYWANFNVGSNITRIEMLLSGDAELFSEEQIGSIAGYYLNTLTAIALEIQSDHEMATLLSPQELHLILGEWNPTRREFTEQKYVHELFESQAEAVPDAVAVVYNNRQMSYGELNRSANRLAHYLRGVGIEPETKIGLMLSRGPDMVVGLLGILKAGAAYLPLDPAYPKDRLAFMAEDANLSALLVERSLATYLPEYAGRVVWIDNDWPLIAQMSDNNPVSNVLSENLAYTIYTSGSTGAPKGVCVGHRNLTNLIFWAKEAFDSTILDGMLASTSICFDLSVFEIFVPLSWGGKAILKDNALHLGDNHESYEITTINTVPSAMAELLRNGHIPESVKTVCLAGEPLRTELVGQIYQFNSVEKVYDLYGPTVATVYATCTLRAATGNATIGRPVANTQIYILDQSKKVVPVGVAGEMYISGEGLARGYVADPAKTAERFLPDLYRGQPGARMYQTGDIGRYLAGGEIEYIGRVDRQVKLRGHRIELAEIEAMLKKHQMVRQAVVMVRENENTTRQLAACIISDGERALTASELRRFLKQRLPAYMIPSSFAFLSAFPTMENGKLDGKALLSSTFDIATDEVAYVAPQSAAECLITDIWKEALGVDNIGIDHNFFDLGGDSLLIVRIYSKLREVFSGDLTIVDMFSYSTVRALAKFFGAQDSDPTMQTLTDISPQRVEEGRARMRSRLDQWQRVKQEMTVD